MLRRILSLTLALLLCVSLLAAVPAQAAAPTAQECAQQLYELGLIKGKGTVNGQPDFALDDFCTRAEGATVLVLLMGKYDKAQAQYSTGALKCPFTDAPDWATATLTWLYEGNYINGTTATTFDGDDYIDAHQFSILLLHALGYLETEGDFTYDTGLDFAVKMGILTSAQRREFESDPTGIRRGGIMIMCSNALKVCMKNSRRTLFEKLTEDGIFKGIDNTLPAVKPLTLSVRYKGGGSTNKWSVQQADIASPACADVDGDGKMEIIFVSWNVMCLDAATGTTKWSVKSGSDATGASTGKNYGMAAASPAVTDIDGDGKVEIVTFHKCPDDNSSCIAVYDAQGRFKSGWPVYTQYPIFSTHISDLDGDGKREIFAGLGIGKSGINSLYVYNSNGAVRKGWPVYCGYGVYADAVDSGDLDGDGKKELVILNDQEYVVALHADGTPLVSSGGIYKGLYWGNIPVCESYDHEADLVRWARTYDGKASATDDHVIGTVREDRNCIMGTYGGVVIDDLDGNGKSEVAFTTMIVDGGRLMRDAGNSMKEELQGFTTFILNSDRTRYINASKGFDWTQMPLDSNKIVAIESPLISKPNIAPIAADLDADGNKELIYTSLDGKMHCVSLDKTEHGAWPYALDCRTSPVMTFATKPAAADLNGDGKLEVVFATYTQTNQVKYPGSLYILDWAGQVLAETQLPCWWGSDVGGDNPLPNGCRAQPVLADVDADGKLEIVLTTLGSGVVVYEVG